MLSPTPTPSISKRSLTRPRPSLSTAIQPPTSPVPPLPVTSPLLSPASMMARKASFQQLTQNSLASVPDGSAEYGLQSPRNNRNDNNGVKKPRSVASTEIEVGDIVDTPGGMHGVVRFIGSVRGKAGIFCGVELEGALAGKGKNDGVVDGVRYFSTNTQLSGMFVPLSRATKRYSGSSSNTPPTPPPQQGYSASANFHAPRRGAERPESPGGRSLAGLSRTPVKGSGGSRPESPVRRTPQPGRSGLIPPATPRHVSAATGSRLLAPSPTPGKSYGVLGGGGPGGERGRTASVSVGYNEPENRPSTSGGPPRIAAVPKSMGAHLAVKKPNSSFATRSASAMERRVPDDELISPVSSVALSHSAEDDDKNEQLAILQKKLTEREQQLDEQANTLIEMEATLSELQSLIGSAQHNANSPQQLSRSQIEDADASQLRALLREKNEKIQMLSTEFDSHRADFRSTIDALEMASTETVRVYEERMNQLMTENRELQERGEDVESVARQLKQLEELVAELEEGLEDARRGEAEARGEVEFLRGEVERCKEELRREKEKSAAAVANAVVGNMLRNNIGEELEKKDEEIRGLKAIIHSLSRDTVSDDEAAELPSNNTSAGRSMLERSQSVPNGKGRGSANDRAAGHGNSEEVEKEKEIRQALEKRIEELEAIVKAKAEREAQLEREIELMERDRRTSIISEQAPKTNSIYSVASDLAMSELTRPTRSASTVTGPTDVSRDTSNATGRESRGTVGSWRGNGLSITHNNENQLGALTPTAEDSDFDPDSVPLFCEICEVHGHDILTCTGMFGSSTKPIISDTSGVKMNNASGATSTTSATVSIPSTLNGGTRGDAYDDRSASSEDDRRDEDIAPLSFKSSSPIVARKDDIDRGFSDAAAKQQMQNKVDVDDVEVDDSDIDIDDDRSDSPTTGMVGTGTGMGGAKSVHLPAAPQPVEYSAGKPVAGKSSKIVDEGKWCALCERDGHDSVDCPFDDDDDDDDVRRRDDDDGDSY